MTESLVSTMDAASARHLTDEIKAMVTQAWDLVTVAYQSRVWDALGYLSWDDYCIHEFGSSRLRLPREERREVVVSLRESGLSIRAIASATGVDYATVHRSLPTDANASVGTVTGVNGKQYRRRVEQRVDDAAEVKAIVATLEDHYGDTLTTEDVDQAIEENLESKRVPTKPDLGGGVSHPARYSDGLIPLFAEILGDEPLDVLDPFAGTGRVHDLQQWGHRTIGVELEPEWARLHADTIVGDALHLPFDAESFDAIVTSPTYGNRLADHHDAADPETRRSYTHDLGRELHAANSGQLQWGDAYRTFHVQAWTEAVRVLRPAGLFVLDVKDHIRGGLRQYVSGWHVTALCRLSLTLVESHEVTTPSMRAGANGDLRLPGEQVHIFTKDAP